MLAALLRRRPLIVVVCTYFAAACCACSALSACSESRGGKSAPGDGGVAGAFDAAPLAVAEDTRQAQAVGADAVKDPDPRERRRAAMALARIADPASHDQLAQLLSDDDAETAAWAAYGLAYTCKGHEEPSVRALAARAAPLAFPLTAPKEPAPTAVDLRRAIARGIGRCGGPLAESVLASWVRAKESTLSEPAVVGLGDLASRKKDLGDEAMLSLLSAAGGYGGEAPPRDLALYGVGRVQVKEAFIPQVLAAAHAALARPGEARLFAIKALARCGKEAVPDLANVAGDKAFTPAERAEAARALGTLGEAGRTAAADVLTKISPDKDPFAIAALGGDDFGVILSLVQSIGSDPAKPPAGDHEAGKSDPALTKIATLVAPGEPPPVLARRIAELRCTAALALAHDKWDADVLSKCAPDGSYAKEKATLASVVKKPLAGPRKDAFVALSKSANLRVREEVVEAIGLHPETGDFGRELLQAALSQDKPGLVATAADVVSAHPERMLVLAASERRAALDPRAPPPTANPAQETDPAFARVLSAALAKKWKEDLTETRLSLLDAAVAVHLPSARKAADEACKDSNVTVRERATKALRALGESAPSCPAPKTGGAPAAEVLGVRPAETTLVLTTDAGELTVVLEPELAPVTAARIASLAKSGFYMGIVVHRVVPAFVVQFGDPDGDGYGGSGTSLRCETAPVPFNRLDVGMALSGRDTGSSQIFVTLARTPHLDGEYTRVGHATGDWDGVAEGDSILDVKLK
jgi:cyclophilin family peptidyl-prolyl cis-trans isomerase